jgi:hypothetical protein
MIGKGRSLRTKITAKLLKLAGFLFVESVAQLLTNIDTLY